MFKHHRLINPFIRSKNENIPLKFWGCSLILPSISFRIMLNEIKKLDINSKLPKQSEIDLAREQLDNSSKTFAIKVSLVLRLMLK